MLIPLLSIFMLKRFAHIASRCRKLFVTLTSLSAESQDQLQRCYPVTVLSENLFASITLIRLDV